MNVPYHHRQQEQSAERCAEEKGKEYGDDVGETHSVKATIPVMADALLTGLKLDFADTAMPMGWTEVNGW